MNIRRTLQEAIEQQGKAQWGAAARLYQKILREKPAHTDALSGLGNCLYQQNLFEQSVSTFERLTRVQPTWAEGWHLRACALNALDQLTETDHCLSRAIEIDHSVAQWWGFRANVRQRMARYPEAEQDYLQAIQREPGSGVFRHDLGMVLRSQGKLDEALDTFAEAARLDPSLALAWINTGNVYRDQGKTDLAIASFEKALETGNDEATALCFLGAARLQAHDVNGAVNALERCHALNPYDRTALAYLAAAWREASRDDDANRLLNYDLLLASRKIDAPKEYASLAAFNAELVEQVTNHSSLQYEREGNTTRKGHQTGDLLDGDAGAVSALLAQIDVAARDYFASLPQTGDHPYLHWRPEQWRYSIWGVVLERQGHQDPHIHPDAWLSGVYYVQLPDDLDSGDNEEGHLEFGQPPASLGCEAQHAGRRIAPEAGRLLLFPSYFYHRTIPFESDQRRISIAFDLRPVVGE